MTMRRVATLSEELDAHDITPDMGEPLGVSLLVAGLCNNARRHPEFGYVGDQTETALLEFAERTGAPLEQHERTGEVPFTSERRMMSVAVKRSGEDEGLLLTKGTLEAVLPLCTSIRTPDGVSALSDEERNALFEQNVGLAGQAQRCWRSRTRSSQPMLP